MCASAPDSYLKKIDEILRHEEIRFCGMVDTGGNLVEGKFREGILPLEQDSERQKIFRELAARVTARKKFEHSMGRIKYSASRREELVMISFPAGEHTIMVTAGTSVNIDRLAFKIIKILGMGWG